MKLDEDIKFIDFHSHRAEGEGHTLIIKNLFAGEEVPVSVLSRNIFFSRDTPVAPYRGKRC